MRRMPTAMLEINTNWALTRIVGIFGMAHICAETTINYCDACLTYLSWVTRCVLTLNIMGMYSLCMNQRDHQTRKWRSFERLVSICLSFLKWFTEGHTSVQWKKAQHTFFYCTQVCSGRKHNMFSFTALKCAVEESITCFLLLHTYCTQVCSGRKHNMFSFTAHLLHTSVQ